MKTLAAIILAAGKGTRMKSALPKVLHEVGGMALLSYVIKNAGQIACNPMVMVVGHGADQIQSRFSAVSHLCFALQDQPLGSAHAVLAAHRALKGFLGDVVILSGDVPLVRLQTLRRLLKLHRARKSALTLATLRLENPSGYGRVVRDATGQVQKIVEETDLTSEEKKIQEVNGGLYIAKLPLLFRALRQIEKNPTKQEYYFTDVPPILQKMGQGVGAFEVEDSAELWGINTRQDLAQAEEILQRRICQSWMLEGITLVAPSRTVIQAEVKIGTDTVVHPDVSLLGKTRIGKGCVLEQGVVLKDMVIGDRVQIRAYSYLEKSRVDDQAIIGPFARIRPDSHLKQGARVGNFVELKKTTLGEGSKANHLSYLGDARIGRKVNVGAGTITCNYDGVHKYATVIEEGVFIGSDTQLVAPVKVGKNAYIGAGTTVTEDVPSEALALSRTPQKVIRGYSKRRGLNK